MHHLAGAKALHDRSHIIHLQNQAGYLRMERHTENKRLQLSGCHKLQQNCKQILPTSFLGLTWLLEIHLRQPGHWKGQNMFESFMRHLRCKSTSASNQEKNVFRPTVDGRNIQTLSTTRTPPTPKLNVRGLARMFRRMDETNQTLETQIQSSYVQHWPLGVRGWRQLLIHGFEYLVHLLSKGVTFAYFWLVSIKSNIFIRSTLCFNLLCSTTLSHRHVASEDSRRQESKPDEEQFQLLFLLLPCAVSVPSAFPVPFALSRGPASKNVFLVSFVETKR